MRSAEAATFDVTCRLIGAKSCTKVTMTMSNPVLILFSMLFAYAAAAVMPQAHAAPVEIEIGVSGNRAHLILQTMERRPDVCAVDDYFEPDWDRFELEFYIVCRAIRIGEFEATYTFQDYPNYARATAELSKGSYMIMIDLPWDDICQDKESQYCSIAVLPGGDFEKGIYTRSDHQAVLKIRTLEELRRFTAVSTDTWVYDWAALERMKIEVHSVPKWVHQLRMVRYGRADFMLEEFSAAEDMSYFIEGARFVPVPGVKIVFSGSRHAVVSKRFSHSKAVFEALQIGLKSLHDRGLIEQGYTSIGFTNPRVKDWKVLCCEYDLN